MVCKHKNTLSLYGRAEKTWISTQKLCGDMIYVCKDCGEVLENSLSKKKFLKLKDNTLNEGVKV